MYSNGTLTLPLDAPLDTRCVYTLSRYILHNIIMFLLPCIVFVILFLNVFSANAFVNIKEIKPYVFNSGISSLCLNC